MARLELATHRLWFCCTTNCATSEFYLSRKSDLNWQPIAYKAIALPNCAISANSWEVNGLFYSLFRAKYKVRIFLPDNTLSQNFKERFITKQKTPTFLSGFCVCVDILLSQYITSNPDIMAIISPLLHRRNRNDSTAFYCCGAPNCCIYYLFHWKYFIFSCTNDCKCRNIILNYANLFSK